MPRHETALPGRSLAGRRILITRPRGQAGGLAEKLAGLGAEPILFPTVEIGQIEDPAPLDDAIRRLAEFDWIVFTSANGVAAFWKRLDLSGLEDLSGLPVRYAAIGPATAQALARRGVQPHLIPEEYIAERLLDALGDVAGRRILLPRADIAREVLAVELEKRGAAVHEIAAYRTLPATPDPAGLAELRRGVDAVTFTSSSTVRNFLKLAHPFDPRSASVVACIGPITAGTARALGLAVAVVAAEYTGDGLVAALADYFSDRPLEGAP
jgi:uroporphyrinogen-III synthase